MVICPEINASLASAAYVDHCLASWSAPARKSLKVSLDTSIRGAEVQTCFRPVITLTGRWPAGMSDSTVFVFSQPAVMAPLIFAASEMLVSNVSAREVS